jgi:hypothetical protein
MNEWKPKMFTDYLADYSAWRNERPDAHPQRTRYARRKGSYRLLHIVRAASGETIRRRSARSSLTATGWSVTLR